MRTAAYKVDVAKRPPLARECVLTHSITEKNYNTADNEAVATSLFRLR